MLLSPPAQIVRKELVPAHQPSTCDIINLHRINLEFETQDMAGERHPTAGQMMPMGKQFGPL